MVKMPSFFTAAVAISARLAIALVATAFFSSHFVARHRQWHPWSWPWQPSSWEPWLG